MAIQSLDDIIAATSTESNGGFLSKSPMAVTIGTYSSYWYVPGMLTMAGAAPGGSGEAYTGAITGAIPVTTDSGNGYVQMGGCMSSSGLYTIFTYDRLVASAPLVLNVATLQTVTHPALPRFTDGEGVMIFGEVQTAGGATACTITLSYTNQDGTSGRTSTFSYTSSWGANSFFNFPLQQGDYGVRSVESATCSISTGTAGSWNIVLARPLSISGCDSAAAGGNSDPIFHSGAVLIPEDTQLCFARYNAATVASTGEWFFNFLGLENV